MKHVNFTRMEDGTREEYEFLGGVEARLHTNLVVRVLTHLKDLDDEASGYRITRYDHCLQSATRAYRNDEDEEMIVAALLHDIGDMLAPYNHSEFAAALLKPYVSARTYWIIKHHGLFQTYYYNHHVGGDRNVRDRFKDHQWYDDTIYFCHHYDQNCFDPDYDTLPIDFFRPMVERVFSRSHTVHLDVPKTAQEAEAIA